MRRCAFCREDRPLTDFSQTDRYCRPCRAQYMRLYRRVRVADPVLGPWYRMQERDRIKALYVPRTVTA